MFRKIFGRILGGLIGALGFCFGLELYNRICKPEITIEVNTKEESD